MCAIRDGAHGEVEAGICCGKEHAYSVVLSGGPYPDADVGYRCVYYGTKGSSTSPSAATQTLINNFEQDVPVRVLRSSQAKNAVIRPAKGLSPPSSSCVYEKNPY